MNQDDITMPSCEAKCCHLTGLALEKYTSVAKVVPAHHGDLLSHDADVWAAEMAQRCDGGDASSIHQVPVMVQHVNIHPDLPHLNRPTNDQHQHSG